MSKKPTEFQSQTCFHRSLQLTNNRHSESPKSEAIQTRLNDAVTDKFTCSRCNSNNYVKAGFSGAKQRYKCKKCNYFFVANACKGLTESEDVWSDTQLGYEGNPSRYERRLNFHPIKQQWLRDYVKRFIKYKRNGVEFSTLMGLLYNLLAFSHFLSKIPDVQAINHLNRSLIIGYFEYLNHQQLGNASKSHKISALAMFFEAGNINGWFNVSPYLIRLEDYPKHVKALPRYIPEEVMQQLSQHLDNLPAPVMRMVLVIQECGLRVGELLQLPLDCLKQDTKGGWFIQFMRWKMKTETTLPISIELSKVIQEQRQYIRDNLGEKYNYLFSGRASGSNQGFKPQPKVMNSQVFIDYLKDLAKEFDIKDSSGKRWNFQSHQFRHTVGTRMINNGVPQHIVQRYLGHESPGMTMVYAHIHDETLRKEIEKYHESRVVNYHGETVELEKTVLSSNDDLEWFKKNVQARALEHGYCARPKVLGDCDIPGFDGCYNCPFWRTNKKFLPILKDTLERTNNVVRKAQSCGWELQVNKNTPIKENLERVIKALENNETPQ